MEHLTTIRFPERPLIGYMVIIIGAMTIVAIVRALAVMGALAMVIEGGVAVEITGYIGDIWT